MTTPGEDVAPFADLGVPTEADYEKGEMWRKARADWSPAWLLLSEKQQGWIERRLAWLEHFGGSGQ
jgi:hypothetical protein